MKSRRKRKKQKEMKKARQRRAFSRPSGAISCRILPSAKQAGQALRRAPHKNLQESRGVYLTFLPLPAPWRRGLVRCADERGLSEKVSLGTFPVSKGDSVPLRTRFVCRRSAAGSSGQSAPHASASHFHTALRKQYKRQSRTIKAAALYGNFVP